MDRPKAKAGTMCPLWKKDVSKVCQTCEWFVPIKGKDPQSEEVFDRWGCSIAWAPMLAVNIAQHVNAVQAATETFHGTTLKVGKALVAQNAERVSHTGLKQINSVTESH